MSQKVDKKLQMRQKLLNSYSYTVSDTIATVMDKYYIDAIIGLVPGAGDVFSSVFCVATVVFVYIQNSLVAFNIGCTVEYFNRCGSGVNSIWGR